MSIENTHYGADEIKEMLKGCTRIFFIGIGGINMSSLAHLTYRQGFEVGGSDRVGSKITHRLEDDGIHIFYEHNGNNIDGYDAVVYTVAISEDNEEYIRAKEKGIPVISRADYMGYIMSSFKNRVGVSGMHGKSTCTSMCAKVFLDADVSPTVLSGAELCDMDGAYCIGKGGDIIFEACEYMDSFLSFNPNISVILNIEMDHVDYFKSMEQIKASFKDFAELAMPEGVTVANCDDQNVTEALKDYNGRVVTFGVKNKNADFRAVNISSERGKYSFDLVSFGEYRGRIFLSVVGEHNVYNALATAAAASLCGISYDKIKSGLEAFSGAKRRMEYKGKINGADVYEDYGHHPTEIKATLSGALKFTEGRLICVYQPHTYSRTAALFEEFSEAFDDADIVIFADIYAAREKNIYGVSSARLAESLGKKGIYGESFEKIAKQIYHTLYKNDVLIVMGAGDIFKLFDYLDVHKTQREETKA